MTSRIRLIGSLFGTVVTALDELERRQLEHQRHQRRADPQQKDRGHRERDRSQRVPVRSPLRVEPELRLREHAEPEHEDELAVGAEETPGHASRYSSSRSRVVARSGEAQSLAGATPIRPRTAMPRPRRA